MQTWLWQSFSSNHSAPFTVVGVFGSPVEAEAAAARLNALRGAMREWGTAPLFSLATPDDRRLAELLGVQWGNPDEALYFDWLAEPVTTVERVLFIDGQESFAGGGLAQEWITRLGGQGLVQGEVTHGGDYRFIQLNLICLAPTEAGAAALETALDETPWSLEDEGQWWFDCAVQRRGRHLEVTQAEFSDIAAGLTVLIAYLRAHGCTEIEYSFHERGEQVLPNAGENRTA